MNKLDKDGEIIQIPKDLPFEIENGWCDMCLNRKMILCLKVEEYDYSYCLSCIELLFED